MVDEQRRVLAVMAHPDDVDFGAAGTVARWVAEGWSVAYVVVTSGQVGGQDARADPDVYGALREAEQRAAAALVGVDDVTFLGYLDGTVIGADPLALRKDLAREFRRHRPHRLLTMNPEPLPTDRFANHPDHRTVGQAALDVTMTGGTTAAIHPELALSEGLPPWRELEETWLAGPGGGPMVVDITPYLEQKIAAIEAHVSQVGGRNIRQLMTERLAAVGAPQGFPYAESFRVISYRR